MDVVLLLSIILMLFALLECIVLFLSASIAQKTHQKEYLSKQYMRIPLLLLDQFGLAVGIVIMSVIWILPLGGFAYALFVIFHPFEIFPFLMYGWLYGLMTATIFSTIRTCIKLQRTNPLIRK